MSLTVSQSVGHTWAIIPVKSFDRGKSRLAMSLDARERRSLSAMLFERALDACARCSQIDRVLIASDGLEALMLGERRGALGLLDPEPRAPFARVMDLALAHVHAQGATRALIAMADLPHVRPRDLSELLATLEPGSLVVAPDQNRRGIGALACRLPAALRMQLGNRDSLARTLEEARAKQLRVNLVHNPRLAHDIDTAADLALVQAAFVQRAR